MRHDLAAVADLIELCFADTLDSDGREYIKRMRAAADADYAFNLVNSLEWMHPALSGFVWQEGDRVLGNASLIPFFNGWQRNYLIANVAVHPELRRRGIGSLLTTQAIEYARAAGAQKIILNVREDNPQAIKLYENLGFVEFARRTTWHISPTRQSELIMPPPLPAGSRFSRPPRRGWPQENAWLAEAYPPSIISHTLPKLSAFRPDWLGGLIRFLLAINLRQWAVTSPHGLQAAAIWQAANTIAHPLYLAAPEDCPAEVVQALLLYVRRQLRLLRPLSLEYPADRHIAAIASAGFRAQQTLLWMQRAC
jgi:GNAT superfamily N-acetyltransferase